MDNAGGEVSRGTIGADQVTRGPFFDREAFVAPGAVKGFDPRGPFDFRSEYDANRSLGMANVFAIRPDDSWRVQSLEAELYGYDPRNHRGSQA